MVTEQRELLLIDPESVAVVRDETGVLHIVANGCLEYQGQRFTYERTIDGGWSPERLIDAYRRSLRGIFVAACGVDWSRSFGRKTVIYDPSNLGLWGCLESDTGRTFREVENV